MQIGTIIGQLIAGSQKTEKTKEITGRTTASYEILKNLGPGSIFEGTILEVKNGQATIGLANGEVVQARLDMVLDLMQGSSMFFQVKSKDDMQIAIKPYSQEPMHNPTLINALQSAGVEVTDKNLTMVSVMMEEQMPIDKQSVLAMVRNRMDYPQGDIKSIVQMMKYQLPISQSNLEQFDHYKQDQGQVMKQLTRVIDDIITTVNPSGQKNEEFVKINIELGKIFGLNEDGNEIQGKAVDQQNLVKDLVGTNEKQVVNTEILGQAKEILMNWARLEDKAQQKPEEVYRQIMKLVIQAEGQMKNERNPILETLRPQANTQANGQVIPEETPQGNTQATVQVLPEETVEVRPQTTLQGEALVKELSQFFQKDEFRELFKEVLEKNWTLEPENLKEENVVVKLYEKLVKQLSQVEQLFSSQGKEMENLGKSMTEVKNQVQFMNDLNQMYHYIQIPLKLFKQHTTGDLYVFTHKKAPFEQGDEITAHLHLQMEHLGTTDVYVRLNQKKISTHFYMESEDSFDLIMDNIDVLTKKLQDRGYEVRIQSENAVKKIDFVEDFLSLNKPVGRVQRYTFDVRA